MEKPILKVKKLVPEAKVPEYKTHDATGFDISSVESFTLAPGSQRVVRTGLCFDIPVGYELQVRPRSGLAAKNMITITNSPGTIDYGYIDEVKVILCNLSDSHFFDVNVGDRIAQLVLAPVYQADIVLIEDFDQNALNKDRGGGFGSTGTN